MIPTTLYVASPTDPELSKVRDYDTIFTVEDAAEDFVDEMAERGLEYTVSTVKVIDTRIN